MSEAQNGGMRMANVNCLRCRFRHEDNGNCTAVGGFCTAVPAAHCPLLREYLDTELTPEKIDMDHEAAEQLRQLCRGYDLGRLVNLAEADKSGRVVVRPYRIDAAVYVLVKDEAVFYPETNGWYIGKETIGAITQDGFYLGDPEEGNFEPNDEIGKTVFLTCEEAEKALEAMKDE